MTDKPTYEELEQKVRHLENALQNVQFRDYPKDKELFRLAFENANIGMCLVNLNGNIFKANAEMANIFGFSTEELERMNVNDIAHPDFKDVSTKFINSASEGISSHSRFEKNYIHKNGSLVTCIVSSSSVVDENKNILFFISHVQDVTKRKHTEQMLIESEQRFRNNMEHVNLISVMLDNKGEITFANKFFLKLTGWQLEEILGRSWFELFIPPEIKLQEILFPHNKECTVPTHHQNEILTRTSERRLIDWSNTILRDVQGNIAGIAGIGIDVTEQKLAEEKLKKNEEKYRLITENSGDVIWILNLSRHKFTFISPSIYNLRGFTAEEAMSQSLGESLSPESLKFVTDVIEKTLPAFLENKNIDQSRQITQLQQPCKNGEVIWVEVSSQFQFNAEGEIEVLGVSRNIESRKKMEEELRKSEARLRELNATKDKFFSIIAHDLKSPFNSILGLSEILVDRVREQNNKEIEQIAMHVNNSALNAFELLTNLLDWSRSQTGRIEFTPEYFDIGKKIDNIIKQATDLAGQKSIAISRDFPKGIIVYADKLMIETVLRNLVANAIKYSHNGGKIEVSVEKSPDGLIVSISDNGVGIQKDAMKKLFNVGEIFTTRGTKNERGTGLGLILCKEFIEKHDGKIWAESEFGKGSRFNFSVPLMH